MNSIQIYGSEYIEMEISYSSKRESSLLKLIREEAILTGVSMTELAGQVIGTAKILVRARDMEVFSKKIIDILL